MQQESIKHRHNFELILRCNQDNQTFCQHQYATYPWRLSFPFRLEGAATKRVYHYLINTSPGLLAGDQFSLSLQLKANSSLYLTDQAATKVHPIPGNASKAAINYQITVDADASLELVPEPIILYEDSVLEQNTVIKLHPTARLFFSEIILPGRLAKEEYYDFNYYLNRLKIIDLAGKLLFTDGTLLMGKQNQFKHQQLFASLPIIGNAIAILPDVDLNVLMAKLDNIAI